MYCSVCGKELLDKAVVCPNCGCLVKDKANSNPFQTQSKTQISLILGIIGIISAWLFALVGHIVSIIGIVYGIKDYKQTEKMSGLILSIIGEVCSLISSVIGAVTLSSIFL